MGGRGAARDRTYYRDRHGKFVKYGEEYTTVLQHGRIKFVTTANPKDSVSSPRETRTQGRVYVTVSTGKLKCITFYRKDGRKRIQIDLDHKHKGEQPHWEFPPLAIQVRNRIPKRKTIQWEIRP